MSKNYFFTSECVSPGHPDKVADQISDAILDAYLQDDPKSHVACETMVTKNLVILSGEIRSDSRPDIDKVVRDVIRKIGYTIKGCGFDCDSVRVVNHMHRQSRDIERGIRQGEENQGAGDQGMMFGYATNETKAYMPLTHHLACSIIEKLNHVRKNDKRMYYLMPDAKSQVTVEYKDGKPSRIEAIVVSTMHTPFELQESIMQKRITEDVKKYVIKPVIEINEIEYMIDENTKFFINPTGRFVEGGPAADTGLTGRKIIVDTYGGHGAHGGGAFSGKDPSKVDRSAAYMARYIAKNLVAAGFADKMLVQLAYAIGVAAPVSVFVNTYGTGTYPDEEIARRIKLIYDLTPYGIEKALNLRTTNYQVTASGCHFGHEFYLDKQLVSHYPWEHLDIYTYARFVNAE